MEEAEALCNKIGIMADGHLRCLGPLQRLKQLYGRGYRLSFTGNAQQVSAIEKILPTGYQRIESSRHLYEFEGDVGRVFEQMISNNIRDWGLSQTTLEDVFVRVT